MHAESRTPNPTVLLRITDGTNYMHRVFDDFADAVKSAEAFAGAGFAVSLVSATGQFLCGFEPQVQRMPSRTAAQLRALARTESSADAALPT
jgi:hypothetical protein